MPSQLIPLLRCAVSPGASKLGTWGFTGPECCVRRPCPYDERPTASKQPCITAGEHLTVGSLSECASIRWERKAQQLAAKPQQLEPSGRSCSTDTRRWRDYRASGEEFSDVALHLKLRQASAVYDKSSA
jgi:hypothetical protein